MIDIYPHILPIKYKKALEERAGEKYYLRDVDDATPTLWDLDRRFRVMDEHEGLKQVLTLASPSVEESVGPEDAVDLSKIANDEMANLVEKYPDRFVAAATARVSKTARQPCRHNP